LDDAGHPGRRRAKARWWRGARSFGSLRNLALGRTTPLGQAIPSGQLSENHCTAALKRPTLMSDPRRSADSFLLSPKTR
jgi:hypothetical protein